MGTIKVCEVEDFQNCGEMNSIFLKKNEKKVKNQLGEKIEKML